MASASSNTQAAAQQSDTPQALKSWWSNFKKRGKKDATPPGPPEPAPGAIFGIPLATSIRYANVAISLMQEDGTSYTYGYIPIIVAKCGVFLKDKATEVQGIFRLPGSARRTNQLKEIFNAPDKYGKGLDWDGYTVHDAANVLRRYLNQLPEPIVPLKLYEPFREPLRQHQLQAVGNVEAKESDIGNFDYDATIATYRTLITQLPPLNRQLLLYILDMLAIFAAKANITKMTAANLAVIFQPGMLHHPDDDKIPEAYRLSQDVVIFLIDQQDNFLLGMPGTAADEKTKKEIESGPPPTAPATPTRGATVLGRSVSTTSRSTNSSRLAGIRRNLSVSSRGSRASVTAAGPGTPGTPNAPGTPGVHRSNTVPSRKSPAVSQSRFSRPPESPNATPPTATPDMTISPPPQSPSQTPAAAALTSPLPSLDPRTASIAPSVDNASATRDQSKERLLGGDGGVKPRTGLSNLLRSPGSDDGSTRQPNKLRKKRQPQTTGMQPAGHSSATSLSAADPDHTRSPNVGPFASADESSRQVSGTSNSGFELTETVPTPRGDLTPQPVSEEKNRLASSESQDQTLKPRPAPSSESGEQHGDKYDASTGNELDGEGTNTAPEKKRRWRFSVSAKRNNEEKQLASSQFLSQHGSSNYAAGRSDADLSKTSSASWRNRSTNNVADGPGVADLNHDTLRRGSRDNAYTSDDKSPTTETSGNKGPISWFKRKIKEREDKEADKERARSPQRGDVGSGPGGQSLGALVNGESSSRQVSTASSTMDALPKTSTERVSRTQDQPAPALTYPTTAVSHVPEGPSSTAQNRVEPGQIGDSTPNAQTGAYPVVPGKIEDYMNDSDREKLDTARSVANRDSLTNPTVGATTPKAVEITVDPAYKATEEWTKANASEQEPTTPKASEVNAGLSALASKPALSQPSAENKAA